MLKGAHLGTPYIRPCTYIRMIVSQISKWYTPDSVSLASLAHQLCLTYVHICITNLKLIHYPW